MKRRAFRLATLLLLSTLYAPLSTGCYLLTQASGQLDILLYRRSVDELASSGRLGPADAAKLKRVGEAKAFAEEQLKLTPSDNYTTFYETRGRPVSWVVSACRQTRFESYTWWFPVVGSLPYKGFYAQEDAVAEARALQAAGFDVVVHPVAAYSTLGWFSDPVFSSMLRYDEAELTALIIHELTHGTIFATGQGDWNEGFATFVGREGALQFLRERGDAAELKRAEERFRDAEVVDALTQKVVARLRRLYAGGAAEGEVRVRREQLWAEAGEECRALRPTLHSDDPLRFFQGRLNNADLIARLRYGRYDSFRKAFEAAGRDWPAFFAMMREAAAKADPFKAMER